MKVKNFISTTLIAVAIAVVTVSAAAQVVVTPDNTQGWSTDETTGAGSVTFVVDASAPGAGALRLTTGGPADRAQYQHGTATLLSAITELSYDTKQVSGPPEASVAYQLESCLISATPTTCAGYTTLNFEPYLNPLSGPIVPGVWQSWDVDAGLFWSTRTVTCSNGTINGGAGGSGGLYTLEAIETACPNAAVFNHYVNIGTGATLPYDIYTDLVNFNGTTYDFEPFLVASTKDQCKNGGWMTTFRDDGSAFRNQGDCIQYVNTGR
jgi:hypothetical protein